MKSTQRYLYRIALVIGLISSSNTYADCEFSPRAGPEIYIAAFDSLVAQGCFGGTKDTAPITVSTRDEIAKIDEKVSSQDDLLDRQAKLLSVLTRIDGALRGAMQPMDATWRTYSTIVMDQLATAKEEIRNRESYVRAMFWERHSDYVFFEDDVPAQFLIMYEGDITDSCTDTSFSTKCQQTLNSAAELTRYISLTKQVLSLPVRQRLAEINQQITVLDSEWDYYFNSARSQFYWEFLANRALYNPPGNRLARPPSGQLILFHPQVAAEYVESTSEVNNTTNMAGIIEVVGYNRLRWQEDSRYSKWPLGFSILATYVPAADGDDWGYGMMFHVKNTYSFGANRRDTGAGNETTWLFSVDLNKLFLEKSAEAKKSFRAK